jgi:transcriptional regulator with XRE-family HTH domain
MADEKRSPRPRYLDGKALRQKRIAAGLEQAELAEIVGTERPAVTHWERGDYGCRLGMLHKLAAALHCQPAELMLHSLTEDSNGETEAA